jgi:thymidylate kinase
MNLKQSKKIVLTGGPGAGKSTLAEVLGHSFRNSVVVLPEAASLLFKGGFPRWSESKPKRALQRAIYTTQIELESAYAAKYPDKILILDRATLDGAAYWPDGAEEFYKELKTDIVTECARYDYVVYLDSAAKEEYHSNLYKNPARIENWEEAHQLDIRTKTLWAHHPKFRCVKSQITFDAKIEEVLSLVGSIVNSTHKQSF